MADFEALNLNITSSSESASAGIESLVKSLTALKGLTASFKDTAVEKTLQNISRLSSGIVDSISTLNIDSGFSSGIVNGLNQITTAVDAISDASIERIERLASALERLGAPGMPKIDVKTRTSESDSASTANKIKNIFAKAIPAGMGDAFGSVASGAKSVFGFAANGATSIMKGITSALSSLYKGFLLGKLGSNQFISSLARIAKYRFLRSLIKGVTDSIKTGLQNVAHYSNEANAALSNFSTGSLYLKNSLGAALYPAIASLIGIFNTLINVAVRAMNIVNMLFSILGGKGTYIKATKQTKDYAGALGGAAGAAGALKQELMGFDEINALSPSGGGGGGGGGGLDYGSMFEEAPVESWLADMIESGDFSGLSSRIAELVNNALGNIPWNKAYAGAKKAADSLSSLINGFFGEINPSIIGQTIAGVINTGAIFVGDFFSDTNFELIGRRIKDAIVIAIHGIEKNALAKAITGKISAAVRFLKGLLPTTSAEWATVTDSVAEMINAAILAIPASDIGTVISRVIVGGLSMITSLAEAGMLTNITSAVIEAIKTAFAGITKEDVQRAWDAVKSDLFNALKLLADINIEIAGIEFNGITAAISSMALFSELKSALGRTMSVKGFKSAFGAFTLFTGVSILIESIFSLLSPILSGGELSGDEIKDKISQAFVGAGFVLLSAGIKGSGIALGLGIAILATYTLTNSDINFSEIADGAYNAIGEKLSNLAYNSNLKSLLGKGWAFDAAEAAAISESAKSVEELYQALNNLSLLPLTNLESTFENAFGSTATAEGFTAARMALGDFIEQYNAIVTGNTMSSLPMNEQLVLLATRYGLVTESAETLQESIGNLNEEIASTGGTKLPSPEELGFEQVGEGANQACTQVESLNESISALGIESGVESEFSQVTSSIDGIAAAAESLPSVVILDSSALSEVQTGATEAANAVGGLTAFINILQKKLSEITSGALFSPIVESANSASEAGGALKTTISSIPDSKSLQITLVNHTITLSRLQSIKNALNGISGKTISIKVKAGLTSGAKSFLTTLKGLTGGSTATSISKLLKLSQFASGGFPKSGDIFVANENGRQELVGRIGSQPAVANQDQIGDAIFRYMDEHSQNSGVNTDELASAIVRGIKASGLGVVKLDGKTISGSINRETQRSGKPAIQF